MQRSILGFSVFALWLGACSSDDTVPDTSNNPNLPAAGAGGSGAATGAGGATSGGATNGGAGTSPEGNPEPGGLDGEGGAANTGGSSGGAAGSAMAAGAAGTAGAAGAPSVAEESMSFFVTSRGNPEGGDFGGIAGADAFCQTLAAESPLNVGDKTWRAYLSTSTENARDRIGAGPWRNFAGLIIANDLEQLHDQGPGGSLGTTWPEGDATIPLDEQGNQVPSNPVLHDIITGTSLDGTAVPNGTCSDWTSQQGVTQNGHSNRTGGGEVRVSWASAHATGCGAAVAGQNFQQGTVTQGGGRGSIYCFAID